MKLNIADIINVRGAIKSVSFTKDTLEMPQAFTSIELCEPINLEGEVESDGQSIYLSGILTAKVKTPCDRCMCETTHDIETEVTEDFGSDVQSIIDLLPTVVETVLVSLPMKVLCHEDCKGMCPVCGQDLNQKSCNCDLEITDPRLEKFSLLFEDDKHDKNNKEV